MEVPDEELTDLLKQTKWSYLSDFFVKIEPWSEKVRLMERVAWIEVVGISFALLEFRNFQESGRIVGKPDIS